MRDAHRRSYLYLPGPGLYRPPTGKPRIATKRDGGLATEQEAGDAAVNAIAEALANPDLAPICTPGHPDAVLGRGWLAVLVSDLARI